MALLNVSLTVILGLKNTPLSPLAGRSYEKLNVLHRCCGYTTIAFVVLHAVCYITGLAAIDNLSYLNTQYQHAAAVAGMSVLTIGVTASYFIRKRQYELFYVVHVTLITVVMISSKWKRFAEIVYRL